MLQLPFGSSVSDQFVRLMHRYDINIVYLLYNVTSPDIGLVRGRVLSDMRYNKEVLFAIIV